ncbi:glucan endo-1-6-beta-glucosidase B [Penicillium taxi]|uniref:glucan endo-1-6-beta-glucosidase B n=1 Tax=Penicillium taxi TaxID=168475 RepID=UPI002545179E|nr:glucan endo-1-6-beta-glucosidase B [Penicillium taxi]KAJ5888973.1 glucan endo-1-6-beta-glucosidase B [Penicillium taxi]
MSPWINYIEPLIMGLSLRLTVITALSTLAAAWLPSNKTITSINGTNLFSSSNNKIRGVNLGTQFVFEPWIASSAWEKMGCGAAGAKSESECVKALGQAEANTTFANHWATWITKDDITEIAKLGLNTVRIPVGYWIREDLVYYYESFPQGGLEYLQELCGWASDAGLYIIMDLHATPGAQTPDNSNTGQLISEAGFFVNHQYERAFRFLEWMTSLIHSTTEFRNVGMLEIVNEPVRDSAMDISMRKVYYPQAFKRIRAAEANANIEKSDYVHIQMMDKLWWAGEPTEYLDDTYYAAFDDHRYLKYADVTVSQESYLSTSCSDNLDANTPTIVGEWSLSPPDDVEKTDEWEVSSNLGFYKKWFAAQALSYEKQEGWVFWTWRTQLSDPRWSYFDAYNAGIIPLDLNTLESPCN